MTQFKESTITQIGKTTQYILIGLRIVALILMRLLLGTMSIQQWIFHFKNSKIRRTSKQQNLERLSMPMGCCSEGSQCAGQSFLLRWKLVYLFLWQKMKLMIQDQYLIIVDYYPKRKKSLQHHQLQLPLYLQEHPNLS